MPTDGHIARLEHLDGKAEFRQLAGDVVSRAAITREADAARGPPLHPTQGTAERGTFALLDKRHQIEDQRTGTCVEQSANTPPQRSLGVRRQIHEQSFDDHHERRTRLHAAQISEIGVEYISLEQAKIRPRQHRLAFPCAREQAALAGDHRGKVHFGVGGMRIGAHPDTSR